MENRMTIYNTGTLTTNKPFTEEAANMIATVLRDESVPSAGESLLFFDDYLEAYLDDVCKDIIQMLSPLGYILNGQVSYYGDWEGTLYITNNNIESVAIEDTGLYEASDQTLITKLKERGYTILKDGIEV
jgi:hypothetical protein